MPMIRDYSQLSWEDEISLNQTLHFSYAKLYFHKKNQEFNKDKYFPIGVKNSDYLFTNIALLLSDENPFIIKMACYGNVLNFKYKKEFSGSIIKIATDVLNEAEMFNITSAVIPEVGGIRQETKSYPGKSLREAILNALCHADYSMPSNIKIEFYVDRVKKIIRFNNVFKSEKVITWDDVKRFMTWENLTLHSVMYRREVLKQSNVKLPEHTFYEDNFFIYASLPYVKTLYYLPMTFYMYYIGRQGQSVGIEQMKKRFKDHYLIAHLMNNVYDVFQYKKVSKGLYHTLMHHLIL